MKNTDPETESDYPVTLPCIECGDKQTVSGKEAEEHGIDNTNFVCHNCQYLYDLTPNGRYKVSPEKIRCT